MFFNIITIIYQLFTKQKIIKKQVNKKIDLLENITAYITIK